MATGLGRRMRVKALTQIAQAGTTITPEAGWFAGLNTVATSAPFLDDGSSVVAGTSEPTSANGYARQSVSWSAVSTPSNDAAAQLLNSNAISWTSSGGAFSTGATVLNTVTLHNTATLATVAESAFQARAPLSNPVAVSATGITVSIAIGALALNLISA